MCVMKKNIILTVFTFVLVFVSSCSFLEGGSTLIDNPTSEDIEVIVDDKTYTVPAGQYIKIDIDEDATHYVTCSKYGLDKAELSFNDAGTKFGVINPTQSKYVIYSIIYTEKDLSSKFKAYDIEGREIYSMLSSPVVSTDLFIKDATLGKGNLDNDIPKSMNYNKMNQDYTFLNRIFRLDDFFKYYDENNK